MSCGAVEQRKSRAFKMLVGLMLAIRKKKGFLENRLYHFGGDSSPDQFLRRLTGLLHVQG
ncbi:MAG: hypothetical protein ACJAQT_004887 [Akkermansiaceae bacterium]|jgi:hypothetical protein